MINSSNKNVPVFLMTISVGLAVLASVSCKKNQNASGTKTVLVGSDSHKANIQLEKSQGAMRIGLSLALKSSLQGSVSGQRLTQEESTYRRNLIAALDSSKIEGLSIRPMKDSNENEPASKRAPKEERKQVSDTFDRLMDSQRYLSSGAARFSISWSEPKSSSNGAWGLGAHGDDDQDSVIISGAEIVFSAKINLEKTGEVSPQPGKSDKQTSRMQRAQPSIRSSGATIIDVIRLEDTVAVSV